MFHYNKELIGGDSKSSESLVLTNSDRSNCSGGDVKNDKKIQFDKKTLKCDQNLFDNTEFVEIRDVNTQTSLEEEKEEEEEVEEIEEEEIDNKVAEKESLTKIGTNIMTRKKSGSDPGTRNTNEQNKITLIRRRKSEKFEKYTSISDDRLKSTSYKITKGMVFKRDQSIFTPNIPLPQQINNKVQTEVKSTFNPLKFTNEKKEKTKNVQTTTFMSPQKPVVNNFPTKSALKLYSSMV